MDFVKTDPAPSTAFTPMVTPGRIVVPPPMMAFSRIVTEDHLSLSPEGGYLSFKMVEFGPMNTFDSILVQSEM